MSLPDNPTDNEIATSGGRTLQYKQSQNSWVVVSTSSSSLTGSEGIEVDGSRVGIDFVSLPSA